MAGPTVPVVQLQAQYDLERGRGWRRAIGMSKTSRPWSARFWFAGSRRGSRWWRPVGVSIVSRPVVVEEVHASGRGGGPSMQKLQQRGMRMKQEECGRREDKRAGRSGREEKSWEAGWVWWIVGRAAVLSGRFLGRSLQLLSWLSPGHFSAAFERGYASSDGRGGGPKTLLRAKGERC
ncbi:uncharacterized protein K444DRAFT_633111 [Hyaloscypha bicolor E]|uniref:Uncharacterized protein n=1 Tax=Hyaloscypha bicolor E TaxID=1095630 RepID=A0A2J6SZC6_9HELO|nr:uncharacterized protein K444DRAFT_633111 [Hyaloscypha bicolor E]PMD56092.1 hypothetical protein K444DRAFT_633111 [Hyaloscypha bicolor E]